MSFTEVEAAGDDTENEDLPRHGSALQPLQRATAILPEGLQASIMAYASALGEATRLRRDINAEMSRAQSHSRSAGALPPTWHRQLLAGGLAGLILLLAQLRVWEGSRSYSVLLWQATGTSAAVMLAAGLGTVGGRSLQQGRATGILVAIVAALALAGLLLAQQLLLADWLLLLFTAASFAAAASVQSLRVVPEDERRHHLATGTAAQQNAIRLYGQLRMELAKLDAATAQHHKDLLKGLDSLKDGK